MFLFFSSTRLSLSLTPCFLTQYLQYFTWRSSLLSISSTNGWIKIKATSCARYWVKLLSSTQFTREIATRLEVARLVTMLCVSFLFMLSKKNKRIKMRKSEHNIVRLSIGSGDDASSYKVSHHSASPKCVDFLSVSALYLLTFGGWKYLNIFFSLNFT